MQRKKDAKKAMARMKEGKSRRSQQKVAKLKEEMARYLLSQKQGEQYETKIIM